MQIYSTKLGVRALDKNAFVALVRTFFQQQYLSPAMPDWDGVQSELDYKGPGCEMHVCLFDKMQSIGCRISSFSEDGQIQSTEIVYNYVEQKMAVRFDVKSTDESSAINFFYSVPSFVKYLEDQNLLSDDNGLEVTSSALDLKTGDGIIASEIILQKKLFSLPVVYTSCSLNGGWAMNVKDCAQKLLGMAHVFKEENSQLSLYLKEKTSGRNPFRGAVGIYFPNPEFRAPVRFVPSSGNTDILLERVVSCVRGYMNRLDMGRKYSYSALVADKRLEDAAEDRRLRIAAVQQKNQSGEELEALYSEFDQQFSEYEKRISELENKNTALEAELAGYRQKFRVSDGNKNLLVYGDEKELYPLEIKDIILDCLLYYRKNLVKAGSRRETVLNSVLDANGPCDAQTVKRQTIKQILRSGKANIAASLKKELEDFGFEFAPDTGNHFKLRYYGDGRYTVILSKTPSDGRSSENCASEIITNML